MSTNSRGSNLGEVRPVASAGNGRRADFGAGHKPEVGAVHLGEDKSFVTAQWRPIHWRRLGKRLATPRVSRGAKLPTTGRGNDLSPMSAPSCGKGQQSTTEFGSAFDYQILQDCSRTMGSPFLQPKAAAKTSMLESGPLARKRARGCGSVLVCRRASSGR